MVVLLDQILEKGNFVRENFLMYSTREAWADRLGVNPKTITRWESAIKAKVFVNWMYWDLVKDNERKTFHYLKARHKLMLAAIALLTSGKFDGQKRKVSQALNWLSETDESVPIKGEKRCFCFGEKAVDHWLRSKAPQENHFFDFSVDTRFEAEDFQFYSSRGSWATKLDINESTIYRWENGLLKNWQEYWNGRHGRRYLDGFQKYVLLVLHTLKNGGVEQVHMTNSMVVDFLTAPVEDGKTRMQIHLNRKNFEETFRPIL